MSQWTIIIPCHNEAESVGDVLQSVLDAVPEAEILVVDDGSTDDTAEIVSQIEGVKLIRLDSNSGKGVALKRGIDEADSPFLVFMDGDGQDHAEDLKELICTIESGARFANGSKFIGEIEKGGISFPNYYGNRFMSGLINMLFGSRVTDSQSGFRAMEKELAASMPLTSTQYEIETEMLCKALKQGVEVKEIPVVRKARTGGQTGFRRICNGLRILATIFRERLTK